MPRSSVTVSVRVPDEEYAVWEKVRDYYGLAGMGGLVRLGVSRLAEELVKSQKQSRSK